MAPRITIVFAVLAFTIVNIAGLLRGQGIMEVWLTSLVAMVGFAVIGFFFGMMYDSLVKESMLNEEAIMFKNYLEDNPEAGGENSELKSSEEDGGAKADSGEITSHQ